MLNNTGVAIVQAIPGVIGVYRPGRELKRDFSRRPGSESNISGNASTPVLIDVSVSDGWHVHVQDYRQMWNWIRFL